MFERYKRKRNEDGTFKMDVRWTPWNEAWSYKMNEELKEEMEEELKEKIEKELKNKIEEVKIYMYISR